MAGSSFSSARKARESWSVEEKHRRTGCRRAEWLRSGPGPVSLSPGGMEEDPGDIGGVYAVVRWRRIDQREVGFGHHLLGQVPWLAPSMPPTMAQTVVGIQPRAPVAPGRPARVSRSRRAAGGTAGRDSLRRGWHPRWPARRPAKHAAHRVGRNGRAKLADQDFPKPRWIGFLAAGSFVVLACGWDRRRAGSCAEEGQRERILARGASTGVGDQPGGRSTGPRAGM